jgi:hypothetical protein
MRQSESRQDVSRLTAHSSSRWRGGGGIHYHNETRALIQTAEANGWVIDEGANRMRWRSGGLWAGRAMKKRADGAVYGSKCGRQDGCATDRAMAAEQSTNFSSLSWGRNEGNACGNQCGVRVVRGSKTTK